MKPRPARGFFLEPTLRTKLPTFAALLVFALPALANPGAPPINNPGFEETTAPGGPHPQAWRPANGSEPLLVDNQTAFAGKRSLRLEHRPPFVGSAQSLDAWPWKGHTLVLRARLKGGKLGDGAAGLWLRGDSAAGKPIDFASSYGQPLAASTDWQIREARLFVGPETERLVFGAMLGAPGTLWVDEIELQVLPPATEPMSTAARRFLDAALSFITDNAYYADRVDWPALKPELEQRAAGATDPAGTYAAIERALAALGDRHSHLLPSSRMEQLMSPPSKDWDTGISARMRGRVGYVRVPGFAFGNEARGEQFSRTLRGHLDSQSAAGACGWIIDLRDNTGGNMYPMIRGLSGLLGGGTLGYFVGRDERTPWNARTGSGDGDLHVLPRGTSAPVAVLQGPKTMSSGEATLLSFLGRPHTRRFGQASGGFSTGNQVFPLPDGSALALTTTVMADRSGKIYGDSVEPDEVIWDLEGADATAAAAQKWIEAQPGCAG